MNTQNKIQIIYEPAFEDYIGCKQLISSLSKVLKKKRLDFEIVPNAEELEQSDKIYVIGQSDEWIEEIVGKCNVKKNIPIILSNQSQKKFAGIYHLISPNYSQILIELKEKLERAGRNKVALYGINRGSDADKNRAELLLDLAYDVESIYQSNGNLENCFRTFLPKAKYYDAVICVSGYAAISLVKKLEKECPEALESLVILSFEEVLKHSKYNQWISMIDLQLEAYGSVAVSVAELTEQKTDISAMTVEMKCEVCKIPSKNHVQELPVENQFFEDPEIVSMAKIEQLLRDADDMDHHIIAMLLEGAKYSEIADTCYMTEGNVKYRVKKYMSICDCKGKRELLELLCEYLQ